LDVAIGQRIRERRRAVGLSQAALADATGVTFQQIQKYERGANRISFSRLAEIARALHCTLGDLAEDLVESGPSAALRRLNDLVAEDGALDLLEAYADLTSKPLRRAIVRHVRALADAERETAR
jgi:transcriptional regulator with XRE-family HTH domain